MLYVCVCVCLCLFLEKSVVDPKKKFMQLVSENITCNQFLSLKEICTYTEDQDDKTQTVFKQEMKIQAHIWGVGGQIERLGVENFKHNALQGRNIMLEAVGHIPSAVTGQIWRKKD